jgi:RecA/RadA recombinase
MAIGINMDGSYDDEMEGKPKKKEKVKLNFADILKVSKQGLSGSINSSLTAVEGRIPNTMSTGSLFLDFKLNGGFLNANFYHLYGPSGGGKSTIFYRTIAANQKVALELLPVGMGSLPNYLPNNEYKKLAWRNTIICDAEGSVNEVFLKGCGVAFEENPNFVIYTPDTGEDWFTFYKRVGVEWMNQHTSDKGLIDPEYIPMLSGIDSLAALIPASLLEDEQQQIAYLARLLSNYLPLTQAVNMKSKSVTVGINQVRENPMAGPYGNPETTKGGQAPYFTACMNVRVSRSGKNEDISLTGEVYEDKIGTAYNLIFGVKKCRYAKSFINYEIQTIMGHGFSRLSDMWNFATATNQLTGGAVNKDGTMNKAKLLTLNIIGRPDLRPKSMKYDDVLKYFQENNLYEIFVKQLFNGSAWGKSLERWQLEMIGNVDTKATPINLIDPKVEQELQDLSEEVKQSGEKESYLTPPEL